MKDNSTRQNICILLLVIFYIVTGAVVLHAEGLQNECISTGWPADKSDLEPDPAFVRGTLANGMRYVVMENGEPEDRVALYLYVNAGSLHETVEQRGVAHFLEHMLFNGSTHFPPGTLVEFFQSIGMSFGGDTNAHTTYDETSYHLILPDGTEDYLRKGFLVMSDYARGALLLEEEVERERGVILAEKRSRDSAGYRTHVKSNTFKYRGTLLSERQIIGDEAVLKTADRALLKSYYDSWYRPENMILVVVGDVEQENVVPLISEIFTPLQAEGEMQKCPDYGQLEHTGVEVFYHHEAELGKTEVSIESVWNSSPRNDSYALQVEELNRYVSILILNSRLSKLQESAGDVLAGVGYHSGELQQRIRYATLTANTSAEKWKETLRLLDEVLRQALQYGVRPEELARAKKDILSHLESAVLTAESRDSDKIARSMIRHFSADRVLQSPQQELDMYSSMLAKITLADINTRLRQDWGRDSRIISVKGNAKLAEDKAERIISSLYTRYSEQDIAPFKQETNGAFPYLAIPVVDESAIKKREEIPGIDAERILFNNNVSVILKPTDFEPNTIRLVIDVGKGKLSEPIPGMAMLAKKVVNDSGTATLPKTSLADVLSGTTVNVDFDISEDSFRWSGSAVSKESELLFQLVYTLLQDLGLREQAYIQSMNGLEQMYERLNSDIQGAVRTRVESFLASGDSRVGLPPWEHVAALKLSQLREWLLPQISSGSMEIAIVGDFEPEQMRNLALKYFGSLQKRDKIKVEASTLTFPDGQNFSTEVPSSVDKSLVVTAWPTAGFWDIRRTRRMHVLAAIFRERLRMVIREKLGASYSPNVFSAPSRVYGEYGNLQVHIVVAPGREKEILDEVSQIGEQLQTGKISSSELERVIGPFMTALKDSVKSNQYWLYSVLAKSERHPDQLIWPNSLLSDFSSITTQEIEHLAKKYLTVEKKATATIKPVVGTAGKS